MQGQDMQKPNTQLVISPKWVLAAAATHWKLTSGTFAQLRKAMNVQNNDLPLFEQQKRVK